MKNVKLIICDDLESVIQKFRSIDVFEREILNGRYAMEVMTELVHKSTSVKPYIIYDVAKTGKYQANFASIIQNTNLEITLFSSLPISNQNYKKELRDSLLMIKTINPNSIRGKESIA